MSVTVTVKPTCCPGTAAPAFAVVTMVSAGISTATLTEQRGSVLPDGQLLPGAAVVTVPASTLFPVSGLFTVMVPVTFERGAQTIAVYLTRDGQLAGIQLAPPGDAQPAAPWEPPGYADPDRFDERDVTLGSGPLATFRQVTLPRLMPAIVAAALLSFTFSFDDYIQPAFTNGTTNTWPIVLFSAVRFGLTPAVNALATIMLGATVLAITITAVILRRSRVQATPRQEQAGGLDAALGLR